MHKKRATDILNLLKNFQKYLEQHPATDKMYEEVRMMNFKIRPLQGDVSFLNLNDQRLIEVLWQLGKLDEFFQKEFTGLPTKQKEVFFQYFESLHNRLQGQLNHLNLKDGAKIKGNSFFEMEIVKEGSGSKKVN
jgi:hypothetical protein